MTFEEEYELAHSVYMSRIEEIMKSEIDRLTAAGLSEDEVGIIVYNKVAKIAKSLEE